jgi:hypothetical protein
MGDGASYNVQAYQGGNPFTGEAAPPAGCPQPSLYGCAPRPPQCRGYYCSALIAAVAGGATVTATITPQLAFQPHDLVLSSTRTAPFFNVNQVIIGVIPQEVANGPTAGDVFSEVAVRSGMSMDPCWSGKTIQIIAVNIDGVVPHDFCATFFGDAVSGLG